MTTSSRIALATSVLVAISAAGVSTPASAQGEIFRDVLGNIGIMPKSKPAIDYRERAPLVLPPSTGQLPPPEPGDPAASNPAWPNDPDVMRRRQQAAAAGRRESDAERMNRDPRLTPDELRANRSILPEPPPVAKAPPVDYDRPVLPPDELKRQGRAFREARARITGEGMEIGQRGRLTDPPAAYLQPSPTAPLVPQDEKLNDDGSRRGWLQRLNPF